MKKNSLRLLCALMLLVMLICALPYAAGAEPFIISADHYQSGHPGTNLTYSHNAEMFNGWTLRKGIDVSYANAVSNWGAVKNSGIDYAIVRVGHRWSESGAMDTVDSKFHSHMQGALNAGLDVGVYFFTAAVTPAMAVEEANFILNNIKGYDVKLPLIMDYEYYGSPGLLKGANLTQREATDVVKAFAQTISDAGYTPMIYASRSVLEHDMYAAEIAQWCEIWVASWVGANDPWTTFATPYTMWQFTSTGSIPGISGYVDCDFMYAPPKTSEEEPEEPQEEPQPEEPDVPVTPPVEEQPVIPADDAVVSGFAPGTTVGAIKQSITLTEGQTVTVTDKNGAPKADDKIYVTGDLVTVKNADESVVWSKPLVLLGDPNGDGEIDIFDPSSIYLYLNGDLKLEGAYLKAADVNKDGEVDIFDPSSIYLYLNGDINLGA